jgi:hypothetical protein
MLAFLWHETNSSGVTLLVSSLLCGLLHDDFQNVSVHPHPHWNLLRIAQRRFAFLWHETNSFGVTLLVASLLCGRLHDVFQPVSVHPHPHWNCYGLLRYVNETKILFFVRSSLLEKLTQICVPSVQKPKKIIIRISSAKRIVWVSVYIYVLIHYKFTVTHEVLSFCPARLLMDYPPYLIPHSESLSSPEMKLTILISHLGCACLLCGDSQNVRSPTPFSFFVWTASVAKLRNAVCKWNYFFLKKIICLADIHSWSWREVYHLFQVRRKSSCAFQRQQVLCEYLFTFMS